VVMAITAALPVISIVDGLSSAKAETAKPRTKKTNKETMQNFLIIAKLHHEGLARAADQKDVGMTYAKKPRPSPEEGGASHGIGAIDHPVS